MTIHELYDSIGSDFEAALARMMKESFMVRLVNKYPSDKSFEKLGAAISEKDYGVAFEAAHTLKGLSMNLGFDELGKAASDITEKLRANDYDGIESYYDAVKEKYEKVIAAIAQLDEA